MAERERRSTMPPGVLELVQYHERRLTDIESRERTLVNEIHELTLSFEKEMSGIKQSVSNCEKPLKRASWVVTVVGAAFLTLIVGAIWKMFSLRLPEPPPPAGSSERLAPDRAEPPLGQHAP